MSNIPAFQVGYVKPGDKGKSYEAMIGFAFQPQGLYPVKVCSSFQNSKKEWQDTIDILIEGASRIEVKRAFVRKSKNGEFFVQCDVDLGWDLSRAIAADAMQRVNSIREKASAA